jgi:hypothetical protein
MLPLDNAATASTMALGMRAATVRNFHDPEKRACRAIAQSLGGQDALAWDVYLFYAKGAQWDTTPPTPVRWAHQLSASWADPARHRWGDDLVDELRQAMSQLGSLS